MNYGKFFRLNNENSDLSNGIARYDYILLKDHNNEDGSFKFPIYLTISNNSIDFHAHYQYDNNLDKNDKNQGKKYLHNTILSLPLSANVEIKDGLTGALTEGWKTTYPQSKDDCLYEKFKNVILNYKYNGLCYADLPMFNDAPHKENIIEKAKKKIKNGEHYSFTKFIRRLILDFIFDLEHTKIFQTSPHYEHISVKLKENFFFSALAAKADFYYQKELIKKNRSNINIEYYLKAEKQWTKYIRSPKAQTNFNDFKDKWFKDPEEEMDDVYGKDLKKVDKIVKLYKNKQQKDEIDKSRNKSSKWLAWHYKWPPRFPIFWKIPAGFIGWHLIFPRLLASIITVWVTVIIGSNLFILEIKDFDSFKITEIGASYWIFFILVILLTIYSVIFYSIRYRSPNIWKNNKYKCWFSKFFWFFIIRPFKILFISFFYSIIFGILLMMMFSSVPLAFPWEEVCTDKPNPFLWSCVFLAMFIGVVLQQVTDEKYTEE